MKNAFVILLLVSVVIFGCKQKDSNPKNDELPKNGYFNGVLGITLTEGLMVSGEKHGCWVEYFGDEEVRRITNYDHGKKNGIFIELNRSGYIISQKNYKKGKLDGLSFEYILGRKVLQATYKDGLLHGQRKSFYEDTGRMKDAFVYGNGKKNGSAVYFYANGKRMAVYKYRNDLLNGKQETYYDNGKIMSRMIYENAVLQGLSEEYNKEGILIVKGNYKDDLKDGVWEYYDDQGNVIETKEYIGDKEQ